MRKKVLVVDDDPDVRLFNTTVVEENGYIPVEAANGEEGLKMVREEKPDLVTLDVMLPGLDGFEVCNRLRGDPETARMPIIMLSAKGQEIDKATGLKVGADRYLSKPVDRSTLLNAIEDMFE